MFFGEGKGGRGGTLDGVACGIGGGHEEGGTAGCGAVDRDALGLMDGGLALCAGRVLMQGREESVLEAIQLADGEVLEQGPDLVIG